VAAASIATLRGFLRGYRVIRDFVVCADAHPPTERRFDRIVFHLLRDFSNRGRKLPGTRCRVDWAVHARPILFVFPHCHWCRIHRGGKEATHFPEEHFGEIKVAYSAWRCPDATPRRPYHKIAGGVSEKARYY